MTARSGHVSTARASRKAGFAPAHYLLNRWPHSLTQIEHSATSKVSIKRLIQLFLCAGGALRKPGITNAAALHPRQLRQLADQVMKHRHRAHYHTPQHSFQVMMAAGFLAAASGLRKPQISLLIVAALIHDLDHMGRYQPHKLAGQEKWSSQRALKAMQRLGLHYDTRQSLERLVLATCPHLSSQYMQRSDNGLIRLLVDADLFGSLFFSRKSVAKLTKSLKHENGLTTDWTVLLSNFLEKVGQNHPASPVAKELHKSMPPGYSYFGHADLALSDTQAGGRGNTLNE